MRGSSRRRGAGRKCGLQTRAAPRSDPDHHPDSDPEPAGVAWRNGLRTGRWAGGRGGRWVAALWWLDQLGSLSLLGHRVQCRQTLRLGLWAPRRGDPRAHTRVLVSVLWRQLMGVEVIVC